ncbi:MAG: 16S rRNA (uracil(1498)-N(3))-methyltransferase [Ignavibacteriales bacterium]|nr:16S rRNA (uracil(1498)-N(3))-methyltransferase [Ignavibacteriales bacterium]MBK7979731.1 16S rRNA (uracil(1498)-N(3))-methyltransferase [Ignavibacteriota bacterium]
MTFSDTEFYYSSFQINSNEQIKIIGEEAKHISAVMRHKVDDEIYVTNGNGKVFKCRITSINKNEILLKLIDNYTLQNKFSSITFYIPILKFADRFEFALEKSAELGIKNYKIFSADKSHNRGVKIDRWQNILISAMKQSLQSFIPKVEFIELKNQNIDNDRNIIFEQKADLSFSNFLLELKGKLSKSENINLFFGPEAGLIKSDIDKIANPVFVKMNDNRLRSETAIITAASLITNILD